MPSPISNLCERQKYVYILERKEEALWDVGVGSDGLELLGKILGSFGLSFFVGQSWKK
jgi:hypothetical protein